MMLAGADSISASLQAASRRLGPRDAAKRPGAGDQGDTQTGRAVDRRPLRAALRHGASVSRSRVSEVPMSRDAGRPMGGAVRPSQSTHFALESRRLVRFGPVGPVVIRPAL